MEGQIVRSLRGLGLALALITLTAPIGAAPAAADAAIQVTGGSWFWASQVPGAPSVGGQNIGQPAALPAPDVPDGDFPVSARAGVSDKESYLHIDAAITAGSTVNKLVLTLSEDAGASNVSADTAAIQAVPATGYFENGNAARPYEEKPPVADGPVAKGVRAPDGTWTFDITAIASQWASGSLSNNGIALRPDPAAAGATFEVVWSGTSPPPTTSGEIVPAGASDAGSGTAPDSSFAPSDSGTDVSSSAPVAVEPDFATPVTTPAQPAPAANPSSGSTGQSTAQPAAATAKTPQRSFPAAFYLAVIAVLVLLGAAAVALGDWGEPTPERRGSVLRVLERRRAQPDVKLLEEPT